MSGDDFSKKLRVIWQGWYGMTQEFWGQVLLVGILYGLIQLSVLLGSTSGWAKYSVLEAFDQFQYWDAGIYAQLAISPRCTAFYPLWPSLIHIAAGPSTVEQALRFSTMGSALIFAISLPLALRTLQKIICNRRIAFLAFFLYALGPNAIFHSIGYTESLFSLMSWGLLLLLAKLDRASQWRQLQWGSMVSGVFLLSIGLSLTRPILVPSLAALAFGGWLYWQCSRLSPVNAGQTDSPSFPSAMEILGVASAIAVGNIVGYGIYGHTCGQELGSIWAPFEAQVAWGRSVAIRPWLLVLPRSLLMDLHGLYLPLLLGVGLLWGVAGDLQASLKRQVWLPRSPWVYSFLIHPLAFVGVLMSLHRFWPQGMISQPVMTTPRWGSLRRFAGIYAIAFSGAHAAINLLINSGNLYSTARHVFGTPYTFVGIGLLLAAIPLGRLYRVSWAIAWIGIALLAHQWYAYATDGWLG